MARGDHLKANRGGFEHHAIDLGDGTVVHFTGSPLQMSVQRTSVADFAPAHLVQVVPHEIALHPDTSCITALRRLECTGYDLGANNCEHLAWRCKTGTSYSAQVETTKARVARDFRRLFVLNPFVAIVAAPLPEVLRRASAAALFHVERLFDPASPTAPPSAPGLPLMFREARLITDRTGKYWGFNGVRWAAIGGGVLDDGDNPEIAVDHGLYWVDENMKRYWQTSSGWSIDTGRFRWRRLPPYAVCIDEPERSLLLASAPPGALNAMLEAPTTIDELSATLDEVRRRGFGDTATYRLVLAWATCNPMKAATSVRPQIEAIACMAWEALSLMNQVQGYNVPADQLVGANELARIVADESRATPIRLAALDAAGVMWRSPRTLFDSVLAAAASSKTADVVNGAKVVLQRVRGIVL